MLPEQHSPYTHRLNPRIKSMTCLRCGHSYPVGDYFLGCPACRRAGRSSNLRFDYQGSASLLPKEKGWRRYLPFLPYEDTVTLGEGNTPVLSLPRLAGELGVRAVYTKNEFQNPTGSHKDRMNPFITARAAQAGYRTVTCASSGNEAASLAAYAAAEGLRCVNVSTESIPPFWKNASAASGARLVLTETPAARLTYQREEMERQSDWYCATNLLDPPSGSSPFGIQGYKTLAFELFDEFGEELPDYIFIPTCRGDLLYGIYEGFADLKGQNLIKALPRLIACEPFPRLELILSAKAAPEDTFRGDSSATASIGGATATWQSVYALTHSQGLAVSVPAAEIPAAVKDLGRCGLYLETSSAIVLPCAKKLLGEKQLPPGSSILFVLTSNGYKNNTDSAK